MGVRFAGIAYLYINGAVYPLRGNLTVSPSKYERAGIAGQDFVHGYSELPRVPYIEGDISLIPNARLGDGQIVGVSPRVLEGMTNVTVRAELANGNVYILYEAWCRSALELNAREGQCRVRWEGTRCMEQREIQDAATAGTGAGGGGVIAV